MKMSSFNSFEENVCVNINEKNSYYYTFARKYDVFY